MRADFHVHSTASDGTVPPADLVAEALRKGLSAIALTDHDTVAGIAEFLAAPAPAGFRRFAGVELSVVPDATFDTFHLLGLGIDPSNAALARFLVRAREGRDARNVRMVANFARLGIVIPPDELRAISRGEVLARPHYANWLVTHGYAPDSSAAFGVYLKPDSPAATRCYAERWRPTFADAAAAVHAAGGLAVLAHPKFVCRAWRSGGVDWKAVRALLASLKARGLDGLEAHYQANTPAENESFARLADELALVKTAGSDYHGAAKPSVTLGMSFPDAWLTPLAGRAV